MALLQPSLRRSVRFAPAAWLGLGLSLLSAAPPASRIECKPVSELLSGKRVESQLVRPASQAVVSDATSDESGDAVLRHLASTSSDLSGVPLPPRQSIPAKQVTPRVQHRELTATVELEVVVAAPQRGRASADLDGLDAAEGQDLQTTSPQAIAINSRERTNALELVPPGPLDESRQTFPGVVAPQPLVDTGYFRSEAVFEGVPVAVSDLAPASLAGETDFMFAAVDGRTTGALAPTQLGHGGCASTATSIDDETLTPERFRQLTTARDGLCKPVSTIRRTAHLAVQNPPDLATHVDPPGRERVIWGEPWPADALRFYRYTVPFSHRPLYFEQPNLERCGHHCGVFTPYTSAGHFFGSAVLLPLHMVLDPPCRCVPTLGDCPTCESYGLCPHRNHRR